jgi:hypothetical protein
VFPPKPHDQRLDLNRQLVGLPVRPAAAIGQADGAEVLVSLEDLVAGLARDVELAAQHRHLLAAQKAGHEPNTLIHLGTLLPRHFALPQSAEVLPMCPERTVTHPSGRALVSSGVSGLLFQSAGKTAVINGKGLRDGNAMQSAGERVATSGATRTGEITIREIVESYIAEYAGRDTTRVQRLTWWLGRLGGVTLADLCDDQIYIALHDLAAQRGRYVAGVDADGKPIYKSKRAPLGPATINRNAAALGAVLTWSVKRRIASRGWDSLQAPRAPAREQRARPVPVERGMGRAACRVQAV